MRQSVKDVFFDYTAGREGFTPFMYCDTLNLVTTGVGNLVDAGPNHGGANSAERARLNNVVSASAMAPAMRLPWRLKAPGWSSKNPIAGELVSPSEVADAWTKVKRQNEAVPDFSQRGGFAYAGLTNLTLDMAGLRQLFDNTLTSFDATLRNKFSPTYEEWPADAQLCVLSMAWAMGPNFPDSFKQFRIEAIAERFDTAALQAEFKGGGSKDDPRSRNAAHQIMLATAASVVKGGGSRETLHFPGASGSAAPVFPSSAPPSAAHIASKFNPGIGSVLGTIAAGGLGYALFDFVTNKPKGRKP